MDKKPNDNPVPFSGTLLSPTAALENAVENEASPTTRSDRADALDHYKLEQKQLWDDYVHRNMHPRDGYDSVGVLMIRWDDELDQLQCADEVIGLGQVFQTVYKFDVRHLVLNNRIKPQHQLSSAMADFVMTHDKPESRNLLITYYSGHGCWDPDTSHFWFEATTQNRQVKRGRGNGYEPAACWNTAEHPLFDSESDVLAIFDACAASDLLKRNSNPDRKNYEVLCASTHLTERPGPQSFTTALIKTLKMLPNEDVRGQKRGSFTTQFLHKRISLLRDTNRPFWWNRLQTDNSPIRLAPVAEAQSPRFARTSSRKQIDEDATDLTLTFQLRGKRKLGEDDVDQLTQKLPKAFEDAGITCERIGWVSHSAHKDPLGMEEAAGIMLMGKRVLRRWSAVSSRRAKTTDPVRAADAVIASPSDTPLLNELTSELNAISSTEPTQQPQAEHAGRQTSTSRVPSKRRPSGAG